MTTEARPGPLEALREARSAAADLGREDLCGRLDRAEERLTRPELLVLVAGEFKQGKSSLVNALLNVDVCPVDDDLATAVPTFVRHGESPWGRAHHLPTDDADAGETRPIEVDRAAEYASELGNPGNRRGLRSVEFGVPRRLLEDGLVLVDTPGVGGLDSTHGAVTLGALPVAEAVVFVSDASQELTATEVEFLRHASGLCPNIVHVVTKVDLYPAWRTIVDRNRAHLDAAGLAVSVFPLSSELRRLATDATDRELNEESGFPAFVEHLRHHVVGARTAVASRAAMADVHAVLDRLEQALISEREALDHPDRASEITAELERARARADDLRSQSARWQLTLTDGIGDLNADTDFDLRNRMRALTREAEESIDATDPADCWEEFEAWLRGRVSSEVVENFAALTDRVEELTAAVEQHFAAAETELRQSIETRAPTSTLEDLEVAVTPEVDKQGLASSTFTALRGTYGGVLMFSMIANMAGLAALGPAVVAIGLVMGRRSAREERRRQLGQRRQEARTAMRKYVDEVSFRVGKDSRDSLRRVQRELRDLFTGRAEELQRSVNDALEAAQRAARTEEEAAAARIAELETRLGRLDAVRRQALLVAERDQ